MTLSRSVKWIIAVVIALLVYWGIDVPTDLADPKTPLFLALRSVQLSSGLLN